MENVKNKITLYVMDFDVELDDLIEQNHMMNTESSIVLQTGPIGSPFDDIMRSIIIAVYRYNVGEIVIVSSPYHNKEKSLWTGSEECQRELQEKVRTLNYLFEHCKPEFIEGSLNEWFEGGEARTERAQNTVKVIRQHPLIPSDVKITEISIHKEKEAVH
ncbi:carbonic anhydrase [Ureibacillus sp. NPDC094379]